MQALRRIASKENSIRFTDNWQLQKCGNLLWSIEDKKPTLGKFKYSGDRRHIPFFVDASLDKLILDLCISLYAEVLIITDSFTHDIELSDFQRFALHAQVRNCKTALEYVFKNDWTAFLDFFNGQVEVKWSKIKIVNQAYLPCKLLVAPRYEKVIDLRVFQSLITACLEFIQRRT